MGSKLSSLLVQDGRVPVKALEDAFARQAILGGQLDTALLEKGLIDEADLIAVTSRATGIPAAQPDLFQELPTAVADFIEQAEAQRLAVCPVAVDRKNLTLLVSETTDTFTLEDLAFQLERSIHPYVTTEVRILQAQSEVYGTPLDPRFAKLLQRLGPVPPGVPEPAEEGALDRRTIEPISRESREASNPGVTILEPLTPDTILEPLTSDTIPEELVGSGRGGEPPLESGPSALPMRSGTADTDDSEPDDDDRPEDTPTDLSFLLPKVVVDPLLTAEQAAIEAPEADPTLLAQMPPIPDDDDAEDQRALEALDILPDQELIPDSFETVDEEPTDPGRAVVADWEEEPTDPGTPSVLTGEIDQAGSGEVVELTAEPPDRPMGPKLFEDTDPGTHSALQDVFVTEPELAEEPLEAAAVAEQAGEEAAEPDQPKPHTEEPEPHADEQAPHTEEPELDTEEPEQPAFGEPEQPALEEPEEGEEGETPAESLDDVMDAMRSASGRDDLLAALAEGVGRFVDGVRIYVVKGNLLMGHMELGGAEEEISGHAPLALEIPTVLARAVDSGTLYMGPTPSTDASASVLAAAGLVNPKGLVLLPVVIRQKTVCLALGYSVDRPISSDSRAPLTALAHDAALAMAELIIRLKQAQAHAPAPAPTAAAPARPDAVEDRYAGDEGHVDLGPKRVISDIEVPRSTPQSPPDLISLLHQLEQGGPVAESAEGTIASMGKEAVQALISWFPGRVQVNRATEPLPPVTQCSAVLRGLIAIGRPVLSSIAPLLLHPDREMRFYATYLISELVFPEGVALLARQLSDPDPDIRRIAGKVLRQFRKMSQFPEVVADLRTDLTNPDPRPRRGAVEALGAVGDEQAIPQLLDLLTDMDPTLVHSVQVALANITKQDFGTNTNNWSLWWEENHHRGRLEWLIDGLVHDEAAIRASSAVELLELTGKSFGYSYDMPPRDREAIRRRFLEWWSLQK